MNPLPHHSISLAVCGVLSLAALNTEAAENLAELGAKVYARPGSCISCHQANGEGLPGAFPPLAKSDWVSGDPVAIIRMINQGIEGEIEVNGKTYSAIMPAQGGQLSDEEFAGVVTYIRQAWGNQASPVSATDIARQKKIDSARGEKPWAAHELRTHDESSAFSGTAQMKIYDGAWAAIPSLKQLPPATKTIPGMLNLKQAPANGGLLIAESSITLPKKGNFEVTLRANGPVQFWVNNSLVAQTPTLINFADKQQIERIGQIGLEAGEQHLRIVVLSTAGTKPQLSAIGKLPGFSAPVDLTTDVKNKGDDKNKNNKKAMPSELGEAGVLLEPSKTKETIVYRGFLANSKGRSIAVGYPEKLALEFDATNATWSMAWRGDFINPGRHWFGRGMGYAEWPAGNDITILPNDPPFAVMTEPNAAWLQKGGPESFPAGYQFLGYDLDKAKRPTFRYKFDSMLVTDTPEPQADGATLVRKLHISATQVVKGLYFRAISADKLETIDPLTYRLDQRVTIKLMLPTGVTPTVRTIAGIKEVLVPVTFTGTTADIQQAYHWEDAP